MPRNRTDGIVIAGCGLAAQRCVETLRRRGYSGSIRMVGDEPHQPYDRPPLSKQLLAGDLAEEDLRFRPPRWYDENVIDLLPGLSAVQLHPSEHRIRLSDETALRYDRLLVATGSRPRTLPVLAGHDNVSTLRTLDDAVELRSALLPGARLAVIGAGFIGQEVSATARKLGCEVTMIEAASCPLAAVLGNQLGSWFAQLHREEGIELLTGSTVTGVQANGKVRALELSTGRSLPVDHVLVGVGVLANTAWLQSSGLAAAHGVEVDGHGRSTAEDVFAAGDAAATFDPTTGRHHPGAHWEAAGRGGVRAAHVMLGLEPGAAPLASFWSDQYGIRIQYVGRARPDASVEIDGEPEDRSFSAIFKHDGQAVAALLVNRPRALPSARALIEKGLSDEPVAG